MYRSIFFLLSAGLCSVNAAVALEASQPWYAWFDGGVHSSSYNGRGEGTFFVPLRQSDQDLVFLDLRNRVFSNREIEGNYAIGYRTMTGSKWNLGAWSSFDARRSDTNNKFYQLGLGIEALHPEYDFRANYYKPLSGSKQASDLAEIVVENTSIYMIGGEEVPLGGYDYEFGAKVPWLSLDDSELRIYAGAFHFEDDDALQTIHGMRGRLQWRQFDVLDDIPGSELSFNLMHSRDDVRGDIREFGISLKIPFGETKPRKPLQWSAQRRRMAEGLVRDIDIVTAKSDRESVTDYYSGAALNRIEYVDGSAALATALAADSNTLFVVTSSGGSLSGNYTLQQAQTLLGGGGSLSLKGAHSNTVASYTASGATPSLAQTTGTIFTASSQNHVSGFTISGGGNTFASNHLFGVANGNSNIHLSNSTVSSIAGYVFDLNGDNSIGIHDSTLDTNYKIVVADSADGGNTITASKLAINNTESGVFDLNESDNNTLTIANVDVDVWGDDILEIGDSNTIVVSDTTAKWSTGTVDGYSIFDVDNSNIITVTNSSFSDFGSNFLQGAASNNVVTLSDVTIDGGDAAGAIVNWGSGDTNTITASNLTITNAVYDVFLMNDSNTVTIAGGSIANTGDDVFDMGANSTITLSDVTVTNMDKFIDFGTDDDGSTITIANSTITGVGDKFIDGTSSDDQTITISDSTVTAAAGSSTNAIDVRYDNVVTLTNVELTEFGSGVIDLTDRNQLTMTDSTIDYSSNGNSAIDLGDDNTITISGSTIVGSLSAGGSGSDMGANNTWTLSNTNFSNIGNDLFNASANAGNSFTLTGGSITNVEYNVFDIGANSSVTLSGVTVTTMGEDFIDTGTDYDSSTITISDSTITGVGRKFIDGTSSDEHTISIADSTISAASGSSTNAIDVRYDNVLTLTNVTFNDFGSGTIDLTDRNQLIMNNSTIDYSANGNSAIDLGDDNTLNISGSTIIGSLSAGGSMSDMGDDNTWIVTNTDFSNIGNSVFNASSSDTGNSYLVTGGSVNNVSSDVFRLGQNGSLTVSNFAASNIGDNFLDVDSGNTISISNVRLSGTIGGEVFEFDDTGNVVNNSTDNVNNLEGAYTLCNASAGAFSGSISFTDGTTLVDGDANCN